MDTETDATTKLMTIDERHKTKISFLLLDPIVFLIFFAVNLSGPVYQTYLLQQTCKNVFEFNKTDCDKLGTEEIESEVSKIINLATQPYVAKIFMAQSILESVIPAIISLFIGPWSDKFGRKPLILASAIGFFLGLILTSVITFFSTYYAINPWYYIVRSIPLSLLGGYSCLISGTFCYLADVRRNNYLAFRMVVTDAIILLGSMCGSLLSSYFLNWSSPFIVFITSAVSVLIGILYVIFFIKENIEPSDRNRTELFMLLFDFELVKKMCVTCFEKRQDYNRLIIWLIISSSVISIFIMGGNDTVMYLFVIDKFNWSLKEYTIFNAIGIANLIVGNIIGVYIFQKLFKLSIPMLALLGIGSAVLNSVVNATAKYSWELYLAMAFGTLRGIAGPMKRAILSYVAPPNDLGKIISFTVSLESISTLCSAPLYTFVYSATIQKYAGAFNFISAGFFFLCYIFLAIVYGIQKSEPVSPYSAIA